MESDLGNTSAVGDINRGSGSSATDARRTVVEDRFDRGSRSGDILRRGHSDGDVLPHPQQTFNEQVLEHGETWMDFLRHSGRDRGDQERAQIAIRRAAMMAADRKRRLTDQHIDSARRRSSSNILFGQPPGGRRRLNMPYPASDHTISPLPVTEGTESRVSHGPSFRRPSVGRQHSLLTRDVTLPRWQPDAEVTKCPICGSAFTFWHRKHHCRKCGRVVCANCSPHRITIPRQYIVHPLDQSSPSPTKATDPAVEVIDLTEDNEGDTRASSRNTERRDRRRSRECRLDPALGGGQEVRLCNPCVPDPNPLPHLYRSPARLSLDSFPRPESIARDPSSSIAPPRSSSIQHRRPSQTGMATPGQHTYDMGQPSNPQRHGSQTLARSTNFPVSSSGYGSAPDSTLHNRQLAALLQENRSSHHRHRHHASTGTFPDYYPHRSPMEAASFHQTRPMPQPQLREEDECPICHSALPPRGPDGSETAREQHVTECIEAHFSSSAPRPHPPPNVATEAAVAASATTPAQAGSTAGLNSGSGSVPSPSFAQRRRTTGMVVYHASEKDCVGEDGEGVQECVICFEEFTVGDEMGRLECLCKFHKICIRQWWDTKGPGSCPVHQGGL